MVESRCAASLHGSVICCAEGGRFILLNMMSLFTSYIRNRIAFLKFLLCICSNRMGRGMLKIVFFCPNSTLGTLLGEVSLKSMVRPPASLIHSGYESYSHSQRRCSMVSTFLHRSQFGSSRILDLNALIFIQMVRLRIWNAVSQVLEVRVGSQRTL
jgi:hypothetical protein